MYSPFKNVNKNAANLSLGIILSLLLLRVAIIFSYVPEIIGIDNNFVHTVARSLSGFNPYPDPTQFPYSGNIYTPLYFNICHIIGKIVNINPEHPIQVYRLCRSVALAFDIASVYFLFEILVKNIKIPKAFAFLAVSLFCCILCYLPYTFSRVDCVFLTLYIATFFYLTRSENIRSIGIFFHLPTLATLTIFAKQNGCVLPIFIFIWLLFTDQPARAFKFIVSFCILFLFTFLIYSKMIGYSHLSSYTFLGIQNRIDPQWFYVNIFKPLAGSILIVPLATGVIISLNFFFSRQEKLSQALGIIYLLQIGFSTAVAFKWGSSLGYYYEAFFLSILLIAKNTQGKIVAPIFSKKAVQLISLITLIFFANVFLQDYLFFVGKQKDKLTAYLMQKRVKSYLHGKLNGSHVLNLSSPNRDFFKLFFYKEMAAPHFDAIDCCLLPDKTFDYTALKNEFSTGKIKYIIFRKGKFEPSIWGQSLQHYQKDTTLFDYDIYMYHLPKQ